MYGFANVVLSVQCEWVFRNAYAFDLIIQKDDLVLLLFAIIGLNLPNLPISSTLTKDWDIVLNETMSTDFEGKT